MGELYKRRFMKILQTWWRPQEEDDKEKYVQSCNTVEESERSKWFYGIIHNWLCQFESQPQIAAVTVKATPAQQTAKFSNGWVHRSRAT
jgi:hypothetical protein